jgi:hypothetical protein
MEKSCEHIRWECPDTEPLGPPQATCANDRPGWEYPRQAWVEAERACEDGGGQEVLSVRVALTVSNEDGQVRLSLQVRHFLTCLVTIEFLNPTTVFCSSGTYFQLWRLSWLRRGKEG